MRYNIYVQMYNFQSATAFHFISIAKLKVFFIALFLDIVFLLPCF